MGLLDNNSILTTPKTGLEGSSFKLLSSNSSFDIWEWSKIDSQKNLRVTFRDFYVWSDTNKLYMVKGKITDTPTVIEVNTTNFPNLRSDSSGSLPTVDRVIACPCDFYYYQWGSKYNNVTGLYGNDCRICVIFSNGQIYHNYPSCNDTCDFYNKTVAKQGTSVTVASLFTKFDESVVWDLPNRKHPVKTKTGTDATLISTGVYYYNPALPDNSYELHPAINSANGYGNTIGFGSTCSINPASNGENIGIRPRFWRTDMNNTNANSFHYMGGYIADHQFTIVGTYNNNTNGNSCRICVFGTQDGGRSWFNMYEFAARDRVKVGESYQSALGVTSIPLAQEGSAGTGLYIAKRRTLVVPSATDKEPSTLFEYSNPLNVSSIVGTSSSIVVTTESAHGYNNGDCVLIGLQDNVSIDGRTFDWIVNSSADMTTGGNGVMFVAKNVTSTTFELTMYVGNPHANIPTRHIHALNRCKDGVSVSCGEQYPHGGWILYNAIKLVDSSAMYNIAKLSYNLFTRLNSTVDSFQRPLGTIVQQEDKDTYVYIGVDNEFTPMNDVEMPEGRTQNFKHNSCGVWKVKLNGIDSQKDNGLIKYNVSQVCYGLQKIGNAFIFTGQHGEFAVSYDNCETWTTVQLPQENSGQDIANFSGMTFDRKFSVNNILVQLKK